MSSIDLLEVFKKIGRIKHFPRGQIISYEGDIPFEYYLICKGVIKIYDIDDQDNEKILHIVGQPAMVPFAFFSGGQPALRWFYAALTDCDVYAVSEEDLQQSVSDDPQLFKTLVNNFSKDVHELLVRLSSLEKTNVQDKLIAALKFLVVCHARERASGWWQVNFPVSHQLLADLVGATRESAAMIMRELNELRLIRNPKLTTLEIQRDKLMSYK